MAGYTSRWDNKSGAEWKKILDMIEPVTNKLAHLWRADVTRELWDAPKLDLRWYTGDGIGRAVQVLIEGDSAPYDLHISGSAWKDFEKPLRHRKWWANDDIEKVSVADPGKLDADPIEKALCHAHRIVSGWRQNDLSYEEELPPSDPNVTAAMVRGRYVP